MVEGRESRASVDVAESAPPKVSCWQHDRLSMCAAVTTGARRGKDRGRLTCTDAKYPHSSVHTNEQQGRARARESEMHEEQLERATARVGWHGWMIENAEKIP